MAWREVKEEKFTVNSDGTRTLQVHSKGDKRYSPMFATVTVNGRRDTIENHYQSAKVFEGGRRSKGWKEARDFKKAGLRQTGWNIAGLELPTRQLTPHMFAPDDFGVQYYTLLWAKFAKSHPELIEYASEFEAFEDPYEGSFPFGQAKVWALLSTGPQAIKELSRKGQELAKLLRRKPEDRAA